MGYLYLDPIYGKNRNRYEINTDDFADLELSCPECGISLIEEGSNCPKCGGKLFTFHIPGSGDFTGCSRKGCEWQKWDTIDAQGKKKFIETVIEDNGCGIPKDQLHKIFEPFFTTKGQKGTGLGLAVIWGIIDNHDGSIKVESEVGKGTAFKIHIPVRTRQGFSS
jgi:hypothetical protein